MAENPWYYITLIGEPEWWAYIAIGLAVLYLISRLAKWESKYRPSLRNFVVVLGISLIIGFGAINILKDAFQIPRPCVPCTEGVLDCNIYCKEDFSFPSGHATTGFIAFTSLFLIVRGPKSAIIFVIPILIAASRVFLGVHTLLDVAMGGLIGIIIPYFVYRFFKAHENLIKPL